MLQLLTWTATGLVAGGLARIVMRSRRDLNLMLSCLAALQAPVIMMSQNRQAARDRSDAKTDYEVNVRAEMEITAVHAKLDLLRDQEWLRLLVMVEEQKRTLESINARLGSLESGADRE